MKKIKYGRPSLPLGDLVRPVRLKPLLGFILCQALKLKISKKILNGHGEKIINAIHICNRLDKV
jgi:hypothetical protein